VLAQATLAQAAPPASVSAAPSSSSGSVYFPITPQRLEDTRTDGKTLSAGGTIDVMVAGGSTGVPSSATAVVVNVTSVNNTGAGYLQAYPKGGSTGASAVNYYYANQLTQNLVTVPVDPTTGAITIFSSQHDDVVVDQFGYYGAPTSGSTGGQYGALPPQRICDTRGGANSGCPGATTQQSGNVLHLQVAGNGGVPSAGVSAVVLNLTVADDTAAGFVQAYAHGTTRPTSPLTSNVNYNGASTQFAGDPCPGNAAGSPAGCQIIANRVIVPVDASGGVDLFTNHGPADLIVDVNGYFTDPSASTGKLFTPTAVTRLHDTRTSGDTIAAGGTLTLAVAGSSSVIPTGASAAVLNVTVDKSTNPATRPGTGFLTVFPGPAGGTPPVISDANFTASSIVPAAVYATLGSDGTINVHNGSPSPLDVVVDAFGYFATPPAPSSPSLTLTPSSQTKTVATSGSSGATITAKATNADGTANASATVVATITSGPDKADATQTCVTATDGTCTLTFTNSGTAGTDNISALVDTDHDNDTAGTDPDGDAGGSSGEPTATATVTWNAAAPVSVLLEPGGTFLTNPNNSTETNTNYPGGGSTSGTFTQVTNTVGKSELFTAGAYDARGNPVPNLGITFTDYHASAANYNNGTCRPDNGASHTSGCVTTTTTATTNAGGKATATVTSAEEGADAVWATLTNSSAITSDGAQVQWGTSVLTVTPDYTQADVQKLVGQASTYTVLAQVGSASPNPNCGQVDAHSENEYGAGPDSDLNNNGTAYISGVGSGETAYSDASCSTAITDFGTSTSHTAVFFKPDASTGQFTFMITSNTAGDVASPFVASQGNGDFPSTTTHSNGPAADFVIGATTVWSALPSSTYSVSLTPASSATVAAGATRTYTETGTANGSPNTGTSTPNSFTFQQLVNSGTTPGDIAYVEYTVGGTTYCAQGNNNNPPQTKCPAADTAVAPNASGVSTKTIGSSTYVVKYTTYGSSTGPGNYTEAQVTGIGTFNVTISDQQGTATGTCESSGAASPPASCVGQATPEAWVDINNNQTVDTSEPSAVAGTTTFTNPTGAGLTLATQTGAASGPGANPGPGDAFSNGQYYQPTSSSPSSTTQYTEIASAIDQSGNAYQNTTQYPVTWTLSNTGVTATHVNLNVVLNGDVSGNAGLRHCTPSYSTANPSNCDDPDLGVANHFNNPNATPGPGANNNTLPGSPGATTITIAGQSSLSFTSYTSLGGTCTAQCSYVVVDSGDDTTLTVSAQLGTPSNTSSPGAAIGSAATATLNWAPAPAAGASASGSVIAFDPAEPVSSPSQEGSAGTENVHDWVAIQTSVGRKLVQFDQSAGQTYTVSATTATEAQFEAALAAGKTYAVTNYGNTPAAGPPAVNPQTNTLS
jgi:hypothetical protein